MFGEERLKLLVPSYQGANETPLLCWKHWPVRLQLAAKDKNVQFWPQSLDIWGQKSIFCFEIMIFVNRAHHQYSRGNKFPIQTTPKNSVSELWVIFRGSPRFLAILSHSHYAIISTLTFGPWSMKLGGTVHVIKKWPTMTADLVLARITEKRPFSLLFLLLFFWPKPCFFHFRKKNGRRAKKSSPTPQWGHRLPVTALVFCACWMTASFHCIVVLWTLPTGNWWGSSNRTLSIDKSTSWRTSRSIALHWWLNQWWCIKKLSSAVAQCQWW